MKKKVISSLLCMAMAAGLLAGCGSSQTSSTSSSPAPAAVSTAAEAEGSASSAAASGSASATAGDSSLAGKKFAIVTKSAGNPYNEKEADGFQKVVEAEGAVCIVKNPDATTADAQLSVIQSLISQKVSSICVAANDENALQASLQEAMKAGIKVSCLDSKVNPASRATFVNQAGTTEIGQALMDAVYDISGGSGDWAILSATSQAANQNAWIDAMKTIMKNNAKYSKLNLVEVAYGDDENQKSTDQTQALLSKYPNLKVICAPTTVGISAAAKVLQDQKSKVKLTGLGLPSEMSEYIGTDAQHSCPYMFLWNPSDVGRLGAYTSIALVKGEITGKAGESFKAGDMGEYKITQASDGGTEVILGAPFKFDPSNINDWKGVY